MINHNHLFKDVTEKDFPCGEIKEEKGIQVRFIFHANRMTSCLIFDRHFSLFAYDLL